MNGMILLIPFFVVRFVLLSFFSKGAVRRAAHFAPMFGYEMVAYGVYQISNAAIFVLLFFLNINAENPWRFFGGLVFYIAGLLLCAFSIRSFAFPAETGVNDKGIYRFSRNPMYLSYFIFFIGCVLLTASKILCLMVILFQIAAHWIVLAEERWCVETFGDDYRQYMKNVRRYF